MTNRQLVIPAPLSFPRRACPELAEWAGIHGVNCGGNPVFEMTDWKNTLYFGDNLQVLRAKVPNDSVDLIYLDPPFNSNASYNVLFKEKSGEESAAQITAFGRVVAAISDRRNFREQRPAVRDRRYSRGLGSQAVYQEIVTNGYVEALCG